jgi:hypothetical protein
MNLRQRSKPGIFFLNLRMSFERMAPQIFFEIQEAKGLIIIAFNLFNVVLIVFSTEDTLAFGTLALSFIVSLDYSRNLFQFFLKR